jgi:hypothetical protein
MYKNMKKIYTLIIAVVSLTVIAASCSKDAFNDKYLDPSKTTTATCDKLMTGSFVAGAQNTFNSYWRMYTWDNYFGKLAQTIGFSNNSGSVYYINDGYANDRWNNFYDILRNFRVLQSVYEKESAEDQAEDLLFVDITEVFVIDHLSQLVDIWGPVPYTEACYLGITGDYAGSFAAYDDDKALYTLMLERLDALYSEISALQNSVKAVTLSKLKKQDFINKGDVDKWLRYCNTLMLRLAVHVSANGELTATGRSYAAKAASRLLVTNLENSIVAESDFDGFNYYENFRDGYKDINNTANQDYIDALQITGTNDPRLPVIYVPTKINYAGGEDPDDTYYYAGEYFGRSTSETDNQQSVRSGSNHNTEETRYYARLNGKTFTYNNNMVSPILSAAEAWFLLAEAYQQGYASGDAKTAFKNGVKYSILAYYKSNMESSQAKTISAEQADDFKAEAYPGAATIEAMGDMYWEAYTNKLEAIMTQKWVHFGILQATQAWTDIRRTGYPALYYPEDGADNNGYKTIPQRVKYPNSDATDNAANYKVAAELTGGDSAYHTLFWAKTLNNAH